MVEMMGTTLGRKWVVLLVVHWAKRWVDQLVEMLVCKLVDGWVVKKESMKDD